MQSHTVRSFDTELATIVCLVRTMSDFAAAEIDGAIESLALGDVTLAMDVVTRDRTMDAMQLDIEKQAVALIALRQPMGSDLRDIVRALRIVRELERIGDLGKNIAKRTIALHGQHACADIIESMRDIAMLLRLQLRLVLHGFGHCVCEGRVEIRSFDFIMNARHVVISRRLQAYMGEAPDNVAIGTHLLFCAKNIEHICEHVARIAEIVHDGAESRQTVPTSPVPLRQRILSDANASLVPA